MRAKFQVCTTATCLFLLLPDSGNAGETTAPYAVREYCTPDNPTNQSWQEYCQTSQYAYVSATSTFDSVNNTNVWSTHIVAGDIGVGALYSAFPSPSVWNVANRYGWRCSATLRLPAANAYFADGRIALAVETGGKMFHLAFDATGTLNPFITAVTNISQMWPSYPVGIDYASTVSYSNYHTLEMRYAPSSQDASVLIDGETVISNYPGNPFGITNRIAWGAGGDSANALAYWLGVTFSVEVPRPDITGVQVQGGTTQIVDLTWQSHSNVLYQVEWTPTLIPAGWKAIGTAYLGNAATCTAPVTNEVSGRAFYRLATAPVQ